MSNVRVTGGLLTAIAMVAIGCRPDGAIAPSSAIPDDQVHPVAEVIVPAKGGPSGEAHSPTPTQWWPYNVTRAGIRVRLFWGSDNTDCDLHFIRPGDIFAQVPGDCYYANENPTWGSDRQSPEDDPFLDVDDVDGFGPETIILNRPDPDGVNTVTAFYFSDHGNGPTDAWVEIFIDGRLRTTIGPRTLANRERWDVAEIDWPSGEITELRRVQ